MRVILAALACLFCGACAVKQPHRIGPAGEASAAKADLVVHIQGFKKAEGVFRAALFDSARGFPGEHERAVATRVGPVRDDGVRLVFEDLRAGQYALAVFHDLDDDGKLGTSWVGIPKEGFGASNNPSGLGPPSFDEARFTLAPPELEITIDLRHL
ncbi:MAG: DUF2141 domain-containing protein [Deltaproteobacteria bacterium]|nr:DUF2141 domain-containing protein [Deltaproteobacteria bacterium]